jgi:tetratricopeptide (TPR) repeat protein
MALNKGDKKAAETLANLSLRDGAYNDVITYLKPMVDAGDTTQVYTLGNALVKLQRYDEAVQILLKNKDNVYVKAILGEAYYGLGDLKNAEKYWKSAVYDHKSGGINSYNKLLELYRQQGRKKIIKSLKGLTDQNTIAFPYLAT